MKEQPWREMEKRLIMDVIETRNLSMFSGKYLQQAERYLEKIYFGKKALLLNSGTAALHIALKCFEIGPGDEVIVPAITYPATALAVTYVGARPIFADVDPTTLTLDEGACRRLITKKTKAVIFVHLFGVPGTVQLISNVCTEKGIPLIEDCAQAFGSELRGKMVGTFGQAGCFSFFESKTISAGEGGALILSDASKIEDGRRYRHHGMDVHNNDRAVNVLGLNYKPSEFQSALIVAQLTHSKEIIRSKRSIASGIRESSSGNIVFQSTNPDEYVVLDKICMIFNNIKERKLAEKLGGKLGLHRYLFRPLYREPVFKPFITKFDICLAAEQFCDQHLVMPICLNGANSKTNKSFQQFVKNITGDGK